MPLRQGLLLLLHILRIFSSIIGGLVPGLAFPLPPKVAAGGVGERIDDDLISSGVADLLEKEAVGDAIVVFFGDVGQEFEVLVFV